jgi:aryl-alcohol dehydrogenase-like predicted oxidoreductase
VALAWLLRRPGVTAPIVSATSIAQLDDILAATRLDLADADMQRLDAASAKEPAA